MTCWISFAARLQTFLDIELGTPVPPCPTHRVVSPRRNGSRRRFAAGDILLVSDTSGRGHITTAIGDPPFEGRFIPATPQIDTDG